MLAVGGLSLPSSNAVAQPATTAVKTTVAVPAGGFDASRIADLDAAVEATIARGDIPGAVLQIGRGERTGGKVLYAKAYGNRSVKPSAEPMTLDTVFDLASLSKSVGCASSVMVLIEQGKIDPQQKVAHYLPEFGNNGKEAITVAHLLLHQGGLIPDNSIKDFADGPAVAWQKICELKPQAAPGTTFKYSDVGFMVLGKLVEKVSGQPLDAFAKEHVFGPAGMAHTGYNPTTTHKDQFAKAIFAPTEQRDGHWMLGEVHDPRAFALGGVAGHAGVFATAGDVGRFCKFLIDGGTIDGKRVMKAETVTTMLTPHGLRDGKNRRTYGLDCDTAYGSPRGERFERGTTFGHTGFTGTSYWIDPVNDCYVVLLTNAVHPNGKGKATPLRRKIGTIAAEAMLGRMPDGGQVATGLDVMAADKFKALAGKRVALVTNQTGLDRIGRRTLDLLVAAPGVKVTKVFSPEHGLFGLLDEKVGDSTDPKTGMKVYSLYGETRKPTPQMMADVDVLVFDIQDVGVRYYTYESTMGLCMEACAAAKVKMMVLDRPNPVSGRIVDGPLTDATSTNFVSYGVIPVSHGMTIGELGKMYNAERKIGCDLTVVPMTGWDRSMWFDETGLTWVNPSPNLRNPTQALTYLGVGQIESANISVGRGTDQPFELLGAPWIDGRKLAAALNAERLPGLRFTAIKFTPASTKFEKKECQGVYIAVTDRSAVEPVKLGVALAWHLRNLFGDDFEFDKINTLVKSEATLKKIKEAKAPADVWASWDEDLAAFRATREKYLMYK